MSFLNDQCYRLKLYCFREMNEAYEKKYSITKAFRWKPKDYISNTYYKRGKTFFGSNMHQSQTPDPFRKTDHFSKTNNLRQFVKGSPSKDAQEKIKRRKGNASKGHNLRLQKSPYLTNPVQIEKIMRLLVPVKGPNESLKLQIKRHNELNIRNAEILIIKKSDTLQDRMKAYLNRMGLPECSKIFYMNSRDRHIKQALIRRGWVQSTEKDSVLFHLKWVYKDNVSDYATLQQGQYYNHFRNNQELTNKNYLRKNIKKANQKQRPNFPISFDIELNDDNSNFQHAFAKFQAYRLLDKLGKFLSNSRRKIYEKILTNKLLFRFQNKKKQKIGAEDRKNLLLYMISQEEIKRSKQISQILSNLFEFVCFVAENIEKDKNISYSIFKCKKQIRQPMKSIKRIEEQFVFNAQQIFQYLSPFYLSQILKMWLQTKQIKNSYGIQNMWILKPTGVSRGSGITISNDYTKINQLRYGKIVQKYLEHPLLLDCRRKFDIRQWVLVTSFSPLKAYAFKSCYARFSSLKYSNDRFQNMQKHLTNYSQNKQAYIRHKLQLKDSLSKNSIELASVMSEQELAMKIGSKWAQIKDQYYLDILKTLECCKNDIIHKQGCFQVFGFDVIIDQNYQSYILEVNLSPACEEREFLKQYLEEMADGLVDKIEGGGQAAGWIQLDKTELTRRKIIKSELSSILIIQRWWRKHRKNHKTVEKESSL